MLAGSFTTAVESGGKEVGVDGIILGIGRFQRTGEGHDPAVKTMVAGRLVAETCPADTDEEQLNLMIQGAV